ncbi:vitamin K epoxide reductase family protein [Ulvibacterium sp.]|uniref:vitamin K epoxide reductase family protein n=1 Tax=Ulvibacterium sp. TaxID=2665914 RepID=UPI003CC65F2D
MDNTVFVTRKILDLLQVRNTKSYIEDTILSHPDHTSLLAVSDALNTYGLKNLAAKIDQVRLPELPLPCIAQVKKEKSPVFWVLNRCTEDSVSFYDNSNTLKQESKESFLKKWTGICLLVDKTETTREPGIDKKLSSIRLAQCLSILLLLLLVIWASNTLFNSEITAKPENIVFILVYTLFKVGGLLIGAALLWFEIDQYNPKLQALCSGGKRVDCHTVLNSKHARLFNGSLSLGALGFSYFFATLLYLPFDGFSASSWAILTFFSFAMLPVLLISAYYQGIVIGQWCKFCVGIQLILLAEIFLGYVAGFYESPIVLQTLPILGILLILPILAWKFVKPLLHKEREMNLYKRGFKKIKNNRTVLSSLLTASRKIVTVPHGLGISLKRNTAEYDIIKVCNPYCEPCANAHPYLEELVNKGKINLQILFTASTNNSDNRAKPVRHLLAINDQGNELKTQQALDNWYSAPKKDYNAFAHKYPLNGELAQQDTKIEAMYGWCKKEEIAHTPTLFINGYELPMEYYSAKDLKEILG